MKLTRNQAIASHFDKATDYDSVSFVQRESAQKLAYLISHERLIPSPSTILEIGCGTGHLTEKIFDLFPNATLVVSDISQSMLMRTEQKLRDKMERKAASRPPVLFHLMEGATLTPSPPVPEVSLITSNLCVQWFPDLTNALKNFSEYLSPGGMICLTTLAKNSFHEWRTICEASSVSCGIPDYPTLSTLETSWPSCGKGQWILEDIHESVPSSLIFLRNLKRIGAALPRSDHNPLSVTALKKAMILFDKTYGKVTYQVAFGLFRKDL